MFDRFDLADPVISVNDGNSKNLGRYRKKGKAGATSENSPKWI
jgi:hypothetical protein